MRRRHSQLNLAVQKRCRLKDRSNGILDEIEGVSRETPSGSAALSSELGGRSAPLHHLENEVLEVRW